MRLLLDTQIFIWWDSEPEKLPAGILQMCEEKTNTLVLSVVSVWEIQIKAQLVPRFGVGSFGWDRFRRPQRR